MKLGDVVYMKLEGVPGDYFRCDRYGLMSAQACARSYTSAPVASREGRLTGCLGCEAGAEHACGPVVSGRPGQAMVCTRCRRGPEEFKNSVGRVRMVRGGTICVSCFNREREVLAGRNAKGTKPRLVLEAVTVAVVNAGRMEVHRLPLAIDRVEAALTVMRRTGPGAMVSWVSGGLVQMEAESEGV